MPRLSITAKIWLSIAIFAVGFLISTAVQGVNRTYDSGRILCNDVLEARIWLGIHFRTADTEAAKMGRRVADYALDRNFEPVRGHGHGGH